MLLYIESVAYILYSLTVQDVTHDGDNDGGGGVGRDSGHSWANA